MTTINEPLVKTISNPALDLQDGQIGGVESCSPLSKQQVNVKNYKMGLKMIFRVQN